MFAQANSEHCRHKIFNAKYTIDGEDMPASLFGMIRNTHAQSPQHTLSAYKDNAAVVEGFPGQRFRADRDRGAVDGLATPGDEAGRRDHQPRPLRCHRARSAVSSASCFATSQAFAVGGTSA